MIPASNQKLLVAAVALEVLGPTTCSRRRRAAPYGGVVAGDLYLVGGGDPLLTDRTYPGRHQRLSGLNADIARRARRRVAAGVTRVDGDVVGDGSRYDDEFFHPSWVERLVVEEAGPFDALLVNDARPHRRLAGGGTTPTRRRRESSAGS